MPSFKRNLIALGAAVLFLLPLMLPAVTRAEDQCGCFCGDNTSGAQENGIKASAGDCKTTCDTAKKQFVGCFINESDFPEQNDLCWTQAECDAYSNESASGTTRTGIWAGQNATCVQGSGHCYSTGFPVILNVPILGVTEVSDITTYIDLIYRWVLPAASLIAVVLAMIAGVQYATAAGNQTQVSKAKQRLGNAVMGVVLLLSAYVIARLIDPRLVTLEALRVPLVKQVVIINPNSGCEALLGYGFGVSPGSGVCGIKGTITSVDEVDPEVANSTIKVGDSCPFLGCAVGAACMSDGVCRTCDSIVSAVSAVSPSTTTCNSIATLGDANDPDEDHEYSCFFDSSGVNACVTIETNGDGYLNCAQIYSDAPTDNPCSIYQTDVDVTPATGIGLSLGNTTFQDEAAQLCASDPCGVASKAAKSGCVAVPGALFGVTCNTR